MKPIYSIALTVGLCSLLLMFAARAQMRLDDSASPVQRFDVTSEWVVTETFDDDERGSADTNAMIVRVTGVEYRLNTSAQRGKNARIYLVLPATMTGLKSPNAIRAEWRTRANLFSAGSITGGGRTLIYTGKINDAQIIQTFDYTIHLDASAVTQTLAFRPYFEIEIIP